MPSPRTMKMHEHVDQLREFADSCAEFDRIVLLGMGGSSLAPEVLSTTYGGKALTALDTTHPEAVLAVENSGDLGNTLFFIALLTLIVTLYDRYRAMRLPESTVTPLE